MEKILVVSGPTASGKSAFAVELAEQFDGEIISADSVAIYKRFTIGTAKPSAELLSRVPHHFVSTLEPTEDFSAGKFGELGRKLISEICSRNRLPIIAGGTGLYIRSLLNGLIDDGIHDEQERIELEDLPQAELYQQLQSLDPASAEKIHSSDTARTRRALEYVLRTGGSITEQRTFHESLPPKLNALILLLEPEREDLYERINARSQAMIQEGIVAETKQLLSEFPSEAKPFAAIGYSHVLQYLQHNDPARLEGELSRDTRRFAKRQFTWWRNQPVRLGWREIELNRALPELIRDFLETRGVFSEDGVFVTRLDVSAGGR